MANMKLLAVCIFLAIAALHCVLSATVASAASVGLYAPDRYDGIPEMCLMPMDFGYCRAKVKRYYFDMRRMKCAMFYFGGCAGNVNNFKTIEECNKVCLASYEDNGLLDVDSNGGVGVGSASAGAGAGTRYINYNSRNAGSKANANSNNNNSSIIASNTNANYKTAASKYASSGGSNKNTIQNRSDDDNNTEYYDDNIGDGSSN